AKLLRDILQTELEQKAPSPSVFREILLTGRLIEPEQLKPLFYSLAKLYDGQDIFFRAALNIACGTDPARRDAILADFDKHFPEWNDKVADLVWELRPKSVLPRLDKLLADPKLTAAQKGRIVDILAVNDDPAADPAARAEAVRTLGQLRDPKAVAALAKLTADPAAVVALGEQASGQPNSQSARAALTALKGIVTGPESATRSKAVEALAGTR